MMMTSSILRGQQMLHSPKKIHHQFQHIFRNPAKLRDPAIISGNSCVNFGELSSLSNRIARCLLTKMWDVQSSELTDDCIIAVCMNPSVDLIVSLLAILKVGAAYMPIDPTAPESRVQHLLQDAKPVLILTREDETITNKNTITEKENVPILIYEKLLATEDNESAFSEYEFAMDAQLAVVLYTSGSTGFPKGVRLSHVSVMNRLTWGWRLFPFTPGEVCCYKTNYTFVDSLSEIFGPLLKGFPIVILEKKEIVNPETLIRRLEDTNVSRLVLVPSLLRAILMYLTANNLQNRLQMVKLWFCSGETFPTELLFRFFDYFPEHFQICNLYGSTEVTADVTGIMFYSRRDAEQKVRHNKVPIGSTADNNIIYLLDGDMKLVNSADMGEICVAGRNVAAGYIGRQDEKFVQNPFTELAGHGNDKDYRVLFKTGDLGRYEDGYLFFEGRSDSQVKIRGHRVDLAEIERAMFGIHGVEKVAIVCHKPGLIEQVILGFYSTSTPALTQEKLIEALEMELPTYMIPKILRTDDIPLLINGKVDRQQLLETYAKEIDLDDTTGVLWDHVTDIPTSHKEAALTLLKTVGSSVGTQDYKQLTLDSNFFDIGGNSLNALYTITRLIDIGLSIDVDKFLHARNLREILQHITMLERNRNDDSKLMEDLLESGRTKYTFEELGAVDWDEVSRMLAETIATKDALAMVLVSIEDVRAFLQRREHSELFIRSGLSFVIKDKTGCIVGAALNYDLYEEPEFCPPVPFRYILGMLGYVEEKRKEHLPKRRNAILENFVLGTHSKLSGQENVEVVVLLEHHLLQVAKMNHMMGVATVNAMPITQHVCEDFLGYQVLYNYQVNQYVAEDGTRPFACLPDTQRAVHCVKYI